MSRVGKQPIKIPAGVTVSLTADKVVVAGPKGELKQAIRPEITIKIKNNQQILVLRKGDKKFAKSLHGLYRVLIANMIQGVTQGFSKVLELHGTGYRVFLEEGNLKILVGFSHPVIIKPPQGIQFQVEENNVIKVLGIDKQSVGQIAAEIRNIRKPENYKGKGIRYQKEVVKIKPGKSAKTTTEGV